MTSSSQKRTCLERALILTVAAALLTVIVLAVLLAMAMKPVESDMCLTKECVAIAARVNSFIDFDVDPCTDFYDFACGSWMKNTLIPEDSPGAFVHGDLNNDVRRIVKKLLESKIDDDIDAVRKARDFYRACMNETYIEQLNVSEFLDFIESFGGWPSMGEQGRGRLNESKFDLMSSLIALRVFKMSPFISVRVSVDKRKSSRRIIQIAEPAFGMSSREYYYDEKFDSLRLAYMVFAKNVAVLFGADPAVAENDTMDLFRLEKILTNFTMSNLDSVDISLTYNKMTIAELEASYSPPVENRHNFNWTTFLQSVLDIAEENITIDASEEIVLTSPRYFKTLFEILQEESERTIKNYLATYIVYTVLHSLPKRFLDERIKYLQVAMGMTGQQSRWKICSATTSELFGMAVGRLFVRENFGEEAKEKALEMISDIRGMFEDSVKDIDWMDEETKRVAVEKAKNIRGQIGYPDFILNATALNYHFHEVIGIEADAFFNNTLTVLKLYGKQTLQNLRKPNQRDYDTWHMSPTTVNAYYYPVFNLISFPAAMLQPPYYSKYQPRSMNYGGIGWLIGHEITHAFGDSGRKYDKHGNMRKWWSDEAIENFVSRTKCFKRQYSNFVSPIANMPINGEYTLGENIVDNAGLQYSFKAYKKWQMKSEQTEPKLPGLDFTHDQLFFLNFAQGWCGMSTKEGEIHRINSDTHSPWRFRITGSLQNSADFTRAFKCPIGSPMSPRVRCKLW